jgi:nicotinate-nucleotide adenylyltransferase
VRIGLFGGSFDPIHSGHVAAARAARAALRLDRVLFVPTGRPPHKPDRGFAPALARYAMVELALLDDAELWASPLELDEARPTYTIDTVERLRRESPRDEHLLLVGADSLAALDTWRRWRDLVAAVEIGVLARPGFAREALAAALPAELAAALADARITWIERVAHPASSTEIRRRLAAGEPLPDGWLDARVLSFAAKYRLYR